PPVGTPRLRNIRSCRATAFATGAAHLVLTRRADRILRSARDRSARTMPFSHRSRQGLIALTRAAAIAAATATTTLAQTPPEQATRIPDSVKHRPTVTDDSDMVARVDNEPLDPTLRGFFTLPGTTTRLRLGGYARLDAVHDFSPIGSTDDFIV